MVVPISAHARVSALNNSIWSRFVVESARSDGFVRNTNNDGTSTFGPMASFIGLIAMRSLELLCKLGCVSVMTLNIILVDDCIVILVLWSWEPHFH